MWKHTQVKTTTKGWLLIYLYMYVVFKGQRLKVVDSQPASESFIPASISSTTGTSANGISVSVHVRSVVPNQGCLHPLQMRDIIAGVARTVRLNDTKFSHLLLSWVSFCIGLQTKMRGSLKPTCHDINLSRKSSLQSILLIYELVVAFAQMK